MSAAAMFSLEIQGKVNVSLTRDEALLALQQLLAWSLDSNVYMSEVFNHSTPASIAVGVPRVEPPSETSRSVTIEPQTPEISFHDNESAIAPSPSQTGSPETTPSLPLPTIRTPARNMTAPPQRPTRQSKLDFQRGTLSMRLAAVESIPTASAPALQPTKKPRFNIRREPKVIPPTVVEKNDEPVPTMSRDHTLTQIRPTGKIQLPINTKSKGKRQRSVSPPVETLQLQKPKYAIRRAPRVIAPAGDDETDSESTNSD